MARPSLFLAAAILLSAATSQASAASCRDASGKFTACPTTTAQKGPCRNAAGKFVKCTAAAKPANAMSTAAAKPAMSKASAPAKATPKKK
jgi:hypothetical protein